jgi:hypothetical protein
VADAYPLDWPLGEPRTKFRSASTFRVDFSRARDELLRELRLLPASSSVISSNVATRRDGIPYANAPKRLDDPGVAVYWTVRKAGVEVSHVMACDRYDDVAANVRAIGLSIEALRMLERHGTRSIADRAFSGFVALPANAGASSWRRVLGFSDSEPVDAVAVAAKYRARLAIVHPDHGGSGEAMAELTDARRAALAEASK